MTRTSRINTSFRHRGRHPKIDIAEMSSSDIEPPRFIFKAIQLQLEGPRHKILLELNSIRIGLNRKHLHRGMAPRENCSRENPRRSRVALNITRNNALHRAYEFDIELANMNALESVNRDSGNARFAVEVTYGVARRAEWTALMMEKRFDMLHPAGAALRELIGAEIALAEHECSITNTSMIPELADRIERARDELIRHDPSAAHTPEPILLPVKTQ